MSRDDLERDEFLAGICVALQCVTASDDGVLWREIVRTAGEEDMLHYAGRVEPDEWELAGFRKYARRELHRSKPRPKTPNVRVEAGPAAKCQARTVENSASPLCGPGISMLGLASNEGLGCNATKGRV